MRAICLALLLAGCGDSDGSKHEPDMAMPVADDLAVAPGEDLARVEDLARAPEDLTLADLLGVDLATVDLAKADQAMAPVKKRMFVTSATYNGNLKGAVAASASGLAAADSLCNTAATALGGTWVAWLSDSTHDAIDRITDVGPWYLLDGTKVFDNKAGLAGGSPLAAVNLTETMGTPTGVGAFPWTGTDANGTKDALNCADWTNGSTGNGECGTTTATDSTWTAQGGRPCSVPYSFYCIEQ